MEDESRKSFPRIIVGGLQLAPDDPLPTPAVVLSYANMRDAQEAAGLVMSLQNGSKPFKIGPEIYMGDTAMKVHFIHGPRQSGNPRWVLCEVFAKADPRHLTCALYVSSRVSAAQFQVFKQLVELNRSYALTVASGDEVLARQVNLVKYVFQERGVRS